MWRKSSYSGSPNAECVELADMPDGAWVRDSKKPNAPHVAFATEVWGAFTTSLRRHEALPHG
ncbi:hypothetical protein AQI95_28690 [Streptomyces yokosukanensis]|uniref:DUF397 domain-containing protein n=2 Tax=Streptomyces yokosukanensis TaxID=67386 RepID=A0A101NZJ6_9ACTN|nr:hypothetical protein AQI95_28690 [Streptomyces yokosukanensis]